jgi:aminoglycoside phosphotransferase (APT) family kinase protein
MLEVAAADPLVPGSNLRAEVVGSSWLLLLPSLHLERVVLEGDIDDRTVDSLTLAGATPRTGGTPDGSAALVVAGRGWDLARARAWLSPDGALLVLEGAAPGAVLDDARAAALAPGMEPPDVVARPGPCELRLPARPPDAARQSAVPARARRVVTRTLRRAGLRVGSLPGPERDGVVVVDAVGPRPGSPRLVLAGGDAPERLPRWLRELAAGAGVDLESHRYRFLPGGDYWAQKVVFLTFPPGEHEPDLAIKVLRQPRFAARLDAERAALEAMALRPPAGTVVPRVAFSGTPAGLPVRAETAVSGSSLAEDLVPGDRCAATDAALDAILDLATSQSPPSLVKPAAAAAALGDVVERFLGAHVVAGDVIASLRAALDAVAASPDPFPSVFHHGDAGVWNLLRAPSGQVAVLDWENAEAGGVPLWDLFYLLQTRGSRLAARSGRRYTAGAFAADLLRPSVERARLDREVRRWTTSLGLHPDLVDPLFLLCWAHHAAKEASRTPPGRPRQRGRYLGYVRIAAQMRS